MIQMGRGNLTLITLTSLECPVFSRWRPNIGQKIVVSLSRKNMVHDLPITKEREREGMESSGGGSLYYVTTTVASVVCVVWLTWCDGVCWCCVNCVVRWSVLVLCALRGVMECVSVLSISWWDAVCLCCVTWVVWWCVLVLCDLCVVMECTCLVWLEWCNGVC